MGALSGLRPYAIPAVGGVTVTADVGASYYANQAAFDAAVAAGLVTFDGVAIPANRLAYVGGTYCRVQVKFPYTEGGISTPGDKVISFGKVGSSANTGSIRLVDTGARTVFYMRRFLGLYGGACRWGPTSKQCAGSVGGVSNSLAFSDAIWLDLVDANVGVGTTTPSNTAYDKTTATRIVEWAPSGAMLTGIARIPAGQWTVRLPYKVQTSAQGGGNCDQIAIYVWRPGVGVVGVIFDNTNTTDHPAGDHGTALGQWGVVYAVSGAAVGGIADGDVLCCEVCSYHGPAGGFSGGNSDCYIEGHGAAPTVNDAAIGTTDLASTLEFDGNLWTPPPTVTSVTPSTGPTVGGTAISGAGANLTGATGASLGGVAVTSFVVVDDGHWTGVAGAHAEGAVDVVVHHPLGDATLAGGYTYADTLSISPSHGPASGGTAVTLTSDGWTLGATVTVDGGTPPSLVVGAISITFSAPAHHAGAVTVSVTAGGITKTATYTYDLVVTPTSGPDTGGQTVRLIGVASGSPTFGGSSATGVAPFDWNSITCLTPAHAAGAVTVAVGSFSIVSGYTYVTTTGETVGTDPAPIIEIGAAVSCAGLDRLANVEVDVLCGEDLTLGGVRIPAAVARGALRGAEMLVERAYMADRASPVVGTMHVFEGRVEANATSTGLRLSVESFASGLKGVLVPRNQIEAPCPNQFCDDACGLSASGLTLSGAAVSTGQRGLVQTTNSAMVAKGADYWKNAVLGASGVTRTVRAASISSGTLSLYLSTLLPSPLSGGASFTVFPDCSKTITACEAFSNRVHFRGTPFIETRGKLSSTAPITALTGSMRFASWTSAASHGEDHDWSTVTLPYSFDLEYDPSGPLTVQFSGDGPYTLVLGVDYTVSGRTVTIISGVIGTGVVSVFYDTVLWGLEREGATPDLASIFARGDTATVNAGTWTDAAGVPRNLDGSYTVLSVIDRFLALDVVWPASLPSGFMQITIAKG